jgi:hypothetical protein
MSRKESCLFNLFDVVLCISHCLVFLNFFCRFSEGESAEGGKGLRDQAGIIMACKYARFFYYLLTW